MRILMTTDTVGGVWTFAEELAAALLQQGCAICLVSIGRQSASAAQQSWCDRTQSSWQDLFRYEHVDAPLEWMQSNERAYEDAAPRLLTLIEEFNAELLHSNQFCFGALPVDIPKIITAHSDVFSWAQACRGGALPPSDWLTRYSALVSRGLRQTDAVTAPTQWMATSLANSFALAQMPAVIPNGRTLSPPTELRNRKLQAVTAGRLWDEAKNLSLLAGLQSPDANSGGRRERARLCDNDYHSRQCHHARYPRAGRVARTLSRKRHLYLHLAIRTVRPCTAGSSTLRVCSACIRYSLIAGSMGFRCLVL